MRETIEKYIKNLALEKNIPVDNTTNLFAAGVLDSLGIILLLSFINEELDIGLNVETLDADKFQTIDSIVEFLSKGKI